MKRALWISFLLASVGLIAVDASAQSCCGLSTAAAESLRTMCASGTCVAAVVPGTTTVTGCSNRVLFADSGPALQCDAGLTYTGTVLESSDQTNISGPDATTNVEIGSTANDANAGTGGTSVVIGNSATNSGNGTGVTLIGSGSTSSAGNSTTIYGTGNSGSSNSIYLFGSSLVSSGGATRAIFIGSGTSSAVNDLVAIGTSPTTTTAVQGDVIIASTGPTTGYNNFYFGKGKVSTTAAAVTLNGTGGSGADNAGGDFQIDGGASTGTARGGNVILRATPSSTTSSTANTEENRLYVVAQRFTLTDNTIATFSTMTLGDDTVGGGTISYCVVSRDATTSASECGEVDYGGLDVTAGAGGEVCPTPTKQGTPLQLLSGATLAVTFAASTGTDLCNIRVTADTNIAVPVALYIVWNASNPGGRTLTPQ